MGARKAKEQQIRNLTQNSTGTYSVSLPIKLVTELGWRQGQKVVVSKRNQSLVIQDWQAK